MLKRATFSWDGMGSYVGYTLESHLTHSRWDAPLFPIATALRILSDSLEVDSFKVQKSSNSIEVELNYGDPQEFMETAHGVVCETVDGPLMLYPIMDGWAWYVDE